MIKTKHITHAIAFLICSLYLMSAACVIAVADNRTKVITGTVVDGFGLPIAGADIQPISVNTSLSGPDYLIPSHTYSGYDGNFKMLITLYRYSGPFYDPWPWDDFRHLRSITFNVSKPGYIDRWITYNVSDPNRGDLGMISLDAR